MHHYTGSYVLGIASRAAIAQLYLSADNQHPFLNYSVAGFEHLKAPGMWGNHQLQLQYRRPSMLLQIPQQLPGECRSSLYLLPSHLLQYVHQRLSTKHGWKLPSQCREWTIIARTTSSQCTRQLFVLTGALDTKKFQSVQ